MDALEMMKYPTVTLNAEEVEAIEKQIQAGELPPDYLEKCDEARETNIFGIGHKTDRKGNPIEQGLGSAGNQTRNSIEAYRKYSTDEPEVKAAHLKRMETELAASNERRKAEAEKRSVKKRGRG